jgi:hypothetical protein
MRTVVREAVVFVVLVAVGAALRVSLSHLPNFAPVAALSLFAGFWFRSWIVAACLPLTVMGVSDYFIGGYDPRVMMIVHASLALPVFWRWSLRPRLELRDDSRLAPFFAGAVTASLAASISFFLLSNLGTWLFSDWYDHTVVGLAQCYVNALPFFRYTLAGDLFFTCVLFGGYAVATVYGTSSVARSASESPTNA